MTPMTMVSGISSRRHMPVGLIDTFVQHLKLRNITARPFPPHPRSQSSTAYTAAHSATAPATALPGSYSRAPAATPPGSFRLPTVPASDPPAENDPPHPRPSLDANPDKYRSPRPQSPC